MTPAQLQNVLDKAAPGFSEYCGSEANLFASDNVGGVFAACSTYVQARPFPPSTWRAIAEFLNRVVGGADDDLDNAACACFIENLAKPQHPLRSLLTGQALAIWEQWEPGA